MTLAELDQQIARVKEYSPRDWQSLTVQVVIKRPGAVGGTPGVTLKYAGRGIDWDHSKFQLFPADDLVQS